MTRDTPPDDSAIFVARPLPRLRAWLALIFLGSGLLSIGGAIEFSTGSPMTAGQGVSSYFAVLFGFHAAAFCGASAIGAFPAIAVRATKIVWLLVLALLYAVAFALWREHPSATSVAQWISLSRYYAPALLPLACGLLWGSEAVAEEGS